MDARSVDLRSEEGIMAERCGMTIARRGGRLPLAASVAADWPWVPWMLYGIVGSAPNKRMIKTMRRIVLIGASKAMNGRSGARFRFPRAAEAWQQSRED